MRKTRFGKVDSDLSVEETHREKRIKTESAAAGFDASALSLNVPGDSVVPDISQPNILKDSEVLLDGFDSKKSIPEQQTKPAKIFFPKPNQAETTKAKAVIAKNANDAKRFISAALQGLNAPFEAMSAEEIEQIKSNVVGLCKICKEVSKPANSEYAVREDSVLSQFIIAGTNLTLVACQVTEIEKISRQLEEGPKGFLSLKKLQTCFDGLSMFAEALEDDITGMKNEISTELKNSFDPAFITNMEQAVQIMLRFVNEEMQELPQFSADLPTVIKKINERYEALQDEALQGNKKIGFRESFINDLGEYYGVLKNVIKNYSGQYYLGIEIEDDVISPASSSSSSAAVSIVRAAAQERIP